MIKVGVTGGIGSGKSLVCQVFSVLGIHVYYADAESKKLADSDPEIREKLISIAGSTVYNDAGLNRPILADLIFSNNVLLEKVNRIIHPRVAAHFQKWCVLHAHETYIIHESAILFESGLYKEFDRIIAVTAPKEIRISRILSRTNMSVEKAEEIMKNQLPQEETAERSDYTIINDEFTLLIPQILHLHKIFLSL